MQRTARRDQFGISRSIKSGVAGYRRGTSGNLRTAYRVVSSPEDRIEILDHREVQRLGITEVLNVERQYSCISRIVPILVLGDADRRVRDEQWSRIVVPAGIARLVRVV